jgi:hypothetical protein
MNDVSLREGPQSKTDDARKLEELQVFAGSFSRFTLSLR